MGAQWPHCWDLEYPRLRKKKESQAGTLPPDHRQGRLREEAHLSSLPVSCSLSQYQLQGTMHRGHPSGGHLGSGERGGETGS